MSNPIVKDITMPNGTTYDIVDAGARALIEELSNYTDFLGVTTSDIVDGSTTNPIVINGQNVTVKKGNVCTKRSKEFIFNGTAWQEYGDLTGLGALAWENSVQASYTPVGTVSTPNVNVTPTLQSVLKSVTNAGAVPTFTVENETLIITAGSMPTFDAETVLKNATAALDAAPTFTGTAATITSTAPQSP